MRGLLVYTPPPPPSRTAQVTYLRCISSQRSVVSQHRLQHCVACLVHMSSKLCPPTHSPVARCVVAPLLSVPLVRRRQLPYQATKRSPSLTCPGPYRWLLQRAVALIGCSRYCTSPLNPPPPRRPRWQPIVHTCDCFGWWRIATQRTLTIQLQPQHFTALELQITSVPSCQR